MGLDMYLEGRKFLLQDWKRPQNDAREDGFRVRELTLELGYWRKHPNLHGYIVNTFAGGKDECQEVPLDSVALRTIINAVRERRLPHTAGFFFGESDGSEQQRDLEIFEAALKWLEESPSPFVETKQVEVEGGEFAVIEVKPLDTETRDWRSVVYRASW